MKRLFSLALFILLLGTMLSGCERFSSTEQESRNPVFQATPTVPTPEQTAPPASPAASTTAPAEPTSSPSFPTDGTSSPSESPYGFSYDLSHLTSFSEFPEGDYLADPKFDTDAYLPDYDIDLSFVEFEMTKFGGVCVTEDTIYFLPQTVRHLEGEPIFLQYYDIASGITLPLCSKPECTHTEDSCSAFLGNTRLINGLRLYDGKIYWMAGGNLMRMNLDGTNHEIVVELDYKTANKVLYNTTCSSFIVHRGYFYIAGVSMNSENGLGFEEYFVYAVPLDGGEMITVMSGSLECDLMHCSILPLGNDIYIILSISREIDATKPENYTIGAFYRWNSKTRKGECLFADDGITDGLLAVVFSDTILPHPVAGDGLYFVRYDTNEKVDKIEKISFQTGSIEEVGALDPPAGVNFTREFILACYFSEWWLLDFDLNPISQKITIDIQGLYNYLGANSDYAFYMYNNEEDGVTGCACVPLHGGDVLILKDLYATESTAKPGKPRIGW